MSRTHLKAKEHNLSETLRPQLFRDKTERSRYQNEKVRVAIIGVGNCANVVGAGSAVLPRR